jgi:hypothetical protein
MNQQGMPKKGRAVPLSRHTRAVAYALVLILMVTSLSSPAKATWTDRSGSLPGIVPTGVVVAVAVAGAAVVGVVLWYELAHKGKTVLKLNVGSTKFADVPGGQPTKETVPVTNTLNEPLTVKEISIDDASGAVAVSGRQVPFTIAPNEKFDVQLTISGAKDSGKARLRIVGSAPHFKKDAVKVVNISYGHQKSKLGKLKL